MSMCFFEIIEDFFGLLEFWATRLVVKAKKGLSVLVKHKWEHRDITSNIIAYKHLHR